MAERRSAPNTTSIEPDEDWLERLFADARHTAAGLHWPGSAQIATADLSPRRAPPFGGHLVSAAQAKASDCPAILLAPPGLSLSDNIKRAQRAIDPFWFYDQVRNHGPWDYKQMGSKYQDFGNFNYGATASAFGFAAEIAKRMAGYAHQQAGTSRPDFGSPLGHAPYGDDPRDQEMIRAGIRYRKDGC